MTAGPKSGSQSRRRLSKEELTLWLQVTSTITPRAGVQLPTSPASFEAEPPKDIKLQAPEPSGHGPAKPSKGSYRPQALPLAPIERRLRQRLARGQVSIDMKMDLHGMRQDEAHSALRAFLSRAQQKQAKLVLIVTGKGAGKERHETGHAFEGGVLRRTVPHWLSAPELRHVVLGFEEAAQTHGGSGALYVRLRSHRAPGASQL